MKTLELEKEVKTVQKIQLVEGEFTPFEALDVVVSLLEEKINFHKLQRLKLYEGNCDTPTSYTDGRIKELEKEKDIAKAFIASVRHNGNKLRINGVLEITTAV
ncbi:hypothetical protein [Spongiimicrobium sp. 3-5]|uniref:hypothetical protein n=1 Tax=Spongiimicrobium sp. 3-5 TaxID=3332596 RepID=UPI003980E494